MKSFHEFIIEGRDAPLYHGTSVDNARSIIIDGGILPKTFQNSYTLLKSPYALSPGLSRQLVGKSGDHNNSLKHNRRVYGISLSRSLNFSRKWAGEYEGTIGYCVFVLDQRKITQRFEIKAYNFYNSKTRMKPLKKKNIFGAEVNDDTNEYEEFIITTKMLPIRYVTAILCSTNEIRNEIQALCLDNSLDLEVKRI